MSPPGRTGGRRMLGQVLKEMKALHEGQIQEGLAAQRKSGGLLGETLVRLGHATSEQVQQALAKQAGFEAWDLDARPPDPAAVARLDAGTAATFTVLPVAIDGNTLIVALADPSNAAVLTDVGFLTNMEVRGVVADERRLRTAIEKAFEGKQGRSGPTDVPATAADAAKRKTGVDAPTNLDGAAADVESAPVIKLLNVVLSQAIRDRASDVHLEPFEAEFRIRYRVDGVLYELEPPPVHLATALIARVKVLARLDIAETRLPQDGRIELTIEGRPVDLRVSTLPTLYGESCVLRILDRSVVSLDLDQVGLREDEAAAVRRMLKLPHGIILVTGPTGSGKTTTLYSALREVNSVDTKIITTEDPVEYDIEGLIQIQVNEEIGVTYARCLRSILRHDPDMILVGEIRDRETAQIAIEASLTGHVVFSTLHTNDAPLAITRLTDIGVEPFLISATLEGIVAQRLVRRVCKGCKTAYEPTDQVLMELGLRPGDSAGRKFAYGKGCEACHYTGYRGRTALFEIMMINDPVRQLIMDGAPTAKLRDRARADGMRSLRESGLLAIYDGATTVEEVLRETIETL
ncbi:MAG TPA: ATPase, T2SS/T4P/T4SS family [Planctomycetota bacterium]|nr:ATPase, T2SS/T4P/T4SS family [Planctomycetota bacterium]